MDRKRWGRKGGGGVYLILCAHVELGDYYYCSSGWSTTVMIITTTRFETDTVLLPLHSVKSYVMRRVSNGHILQRYLRFIF